MSSLKAVYWDLDGTIANTEFEAHLPSFNKAFRDFGLDWYWDQHKYKELLKIHGGKSRILFYSQSLNVLITNKLITEIHERKQDYYLNSIKNNLITLKKGVRRLVYELCNKNVRQFIVTSSSKKQASTIINHLFKEFNPFEFIISSDDVELNKPSPLPYLKAMKLSGIKFNNSIVFEDSEQGLRSSLAAKLPTIYIPSNIPTVISKDVVFDCFVDTLGNENHKPKVFKGPVLFNQYVDYEYLENLLKVMF